MTEIVDTSRLTDRVAALVDAARRAGADAADAVAVVGRSTSVSVRLGKVEATESSESDDLSLRVFVGRRVASVSANAASDPDMLARRAVDMARVSPEDPFQGLADRTRLAKTVPDLDLFDGTIVSSERLKEDALAAEEAARAIPGVTNSGGSGASAGVGGLVLATSAGFLGSYVASRFSRSVSAVAGEGTGMERDYDFSSRLHFADLDSPETIGRKAGERAVRRLGARKASTGPVTVIFDPRVARGIAGHLAGAINGASIARKTSFLKDRLGQQLFAGNIRIVDDPLRVRGLRSQAFDAEGVRVKKLAIVDGGVLTSWLLDCATARELGMTTTGHAHRGVSSAPSPGAYNLHLEAGTASPKQLIADIKQGFYVTDLIGSGVNGVTGDYSRGASGFWIENGEITYPVSEVTIAGHLLEMFKSMTPANDLEFRYGINAPTLRIEGLTLGGR